MTQYPHAGAVVDSRVVREGVPNTESISAALYDYTVLPGIREVPMAEFGDAAKPHNLFYAANDIEHARRLAEEIRSSKEISPLIVVIDDEGPYILEGAHRLGALWLLGAQSFPALVVIDEERETNPTKKLKNRLMR